MSSDLRAGLGAGRLQRTLAVRLLRVACAGGIALVALLALMAAEPSARRGQSDGAPSAVARAQSAECTAGIDERLSTSPTASQSARIVVRHQLARARATEVDGATTLTSPLLASPARLFGDVAKSARTELRRLAQRHAPSGEASPFDATAPPIVSRRNG